MLLDNPYSNDRRVFTEAETLSYAGHDISVVAVKSSEFPDFENKNGVKIYRFLESDIFDIKKPKVYHKYAKEIIEKFDFEVIHAHDQYMLHLGATIKKIKKNVSLVYDSHELFHEWPLNLSNFKNFWVAIKSYIVRKMLVRREKKNAKQVNRFITVNQSLANILKDYFNHPKEIVFLRNLPERNLIQTPHNDLRVKLQIPDSKKILIYIGANLYLHTINIEQVMYELADQDDIAMVFICGLATPSTKQVIEFVKENNFNNIYFHDLVKPEEIMYYLRGGDVGILATWNKKNKSYWYALGNKFFEYIQAGIPVLATAQPEHIPILEKYECGVLVNPDNKGVFLEGFRKIISNYDYYKQKTILAAVDLCWENDSTKLLNLYKEI